MGNKWFLFQEEQVGGWFRSCWTGSIFTSDLLWIFLNCSFNKFCLIFQEKKMITRISGPLTKWLKVIKGQTTPAFPVPFVPRKRKEKSFRSWWTLTRTRSCNAVYSCWRSVCNKPGTQEAIQFCLGIVSGNYTLLKSIPEL